MDYRGGIKITYFKCVYFEKQENGKFKQCGKLCSNMINGSTYCDKHLKEVVGE
jgi:hypothetical protein